MTRSSLRTGVLALCALAAVLLSALLLRQAAPQLRAAPQSEMVRAPEFPADAPWLNTDKPLTLRGLRGKIVLLDFWTYCCINCMHILPDLKNLEEKYPNELVVIGVHSAKFENESETQNIRNAILRYKISHPVINDKEMRMWDEYAVRAWPTLTLIDPEGRIVRQQGGEGQYAGLDILIGRMVKEYKARGALNTTPLEFALEAAKVEKTDLRFPGKVLVSGNKLFVADSNHNRVIVSDLEGNVETVFGSGLQGFVDGDAATATFNNPQGMTLAEGGSTLIVADTDNHAIRSLNLQTKKVATIAGNGKQARYGEYGGIGTRASLASPWDVLAVGSELYIAMAGTHQIWGMNLQTNLVMPYAGSGAEARYDATLAEAAFAQPSGLATDGKVLYFADSESSSIRTVPLLGQGDATSTLVGGAPDPRNLFAFGDKDGAGFDAKLQHPLGVAFREGELLVADTYNHKIKVIDLRSGVISSLSFDQKFNEPAGIALSGQKLFVADTNNHAIRVVDLDTKKASTLEFKSLPEPKTAGASAAPSTAPEGYLTLGLQALAPNAKGEIVFDVKLPKGYKLNKEAPQKWEARVEGAGITPEKTVAKNFDLPLRVKYSSAAGGRGTLVVSSMIYYCTDDMGICKILPVKLRVPFEIRPGGASLLRASARITDADKVAF